MKPVLNLNSLNVRGLSNERKRKVMFQWLKQNYTGIVLLQETHSSEKDEKQWSSEWKNRIIFSHGTNRQCGVAILLDSKYDYNIIEIDRDSHGRFLLLIMEINNEKYTIINLYAPTKNNANAQKDFYADLEKKLDKYIGTNIVIGGDCNVCLNPEIDKHGGIKESKSAAANQILNLLESHDLTDVWRSLNENEKRFTWRNMTKKGRVASRLDYWLMSSHLLFAVNDVQIMPSIKTDHSMITLSIFLQKSPERGNGFWKINNSLLTDKKYIEIIENFLDNCREQYDTINNKALVWDMIKCSIRGLTIKYSINRSKERKQYANDLYAQLKQYESKLDQDDNYKDICDTIRKEIEQIEEEKLRGNIIRSRAQWIEEGEKCSKYFMQLENRNYKSKCITALLNENNHIIDKQEDILKECRSFYKNLYTEQNDRRNFEDSTFFNNEHNVLSENESNLCESLVSENECYNSLLQFPNNKTPGIDGLSTEFYKVFWHKISSFLMDSYNYSFENDLLSLDQRRALLILIPKGEKDKRILQNWRPISLLNMDYKILAKVLANRLQIVISNIVSQDQVGYIKGRYIGDNIRTLLDVLDITKNKIDPGLLVMIDFQKAFDTLSWEFLYKTLHYFNFGPTFIKYIRLLYTEPECSVTNNGFHTEFFTVSRGIRQGCPISALLFIMCVEVLAIRIREMTNIQGIKLKDKELKITQYADDTCLYLNGVNSLENVLKVFEDFYRYAGLKLNVDKTKLLWLGKTNRIGKINGISIEQNPVKILGIWVCKNNDEMLKINFEERLVKLKSLLNMWSQRQLSIKGKIQILKVKALPLLIYVCNFLYVSSDILETIEKTLYDFVWNKKHHVKKLTLTQKIVDGGLNMPDIVATIQSNKLSFIKRIIDTKTNCNKTAAVILKTSNVERFLGYKNNTRFIHALPLYYKQLLDIWYSFHNIKPTQVEDILAENIWLNHRILIDNKPAFNKVWNNAGIRCVKDVILGNRLMTKQEIETNYHIQCNWLEYNGIVTAIPKDWINEIKNTNNVDFIGIKNDVLSILIDEKVVDIRQTTCKQIYSHAVRMKADRPTCYYKWEESYYYATFDWELINAIPYQCTSETYLQSLQYKIIHRFFPCKTNLYVWSLEENDKCNYCNNEIDTLGHYFVECNALHVFWKRLKAWFLTNFEFVINFKTLDILLGIPNYDKNVDIDILNFMLLFAKNYIYSCKKINNSIDFYTFQVKLKMHLEIEEYRCKLYNKLYEFNAKWAPIADIL